MINKRDKNNKDNYIVLQVTLFDVTGKYRPVSTLVKVESVAWFKEHSKEVKEQAIKQICLKRRWTGEDLIKFGYTQLKVRNYTLFQEIEKNKKERAKERKEKENNENK
jgi:hypothetical protein